MYALNVDYIKQVAKSKGYKGLKPLLEQLGLHRNTLDRYMRNSQILPKSIEKVFNALDIPIEKGLYKSISQDDLPIDELVHEIHLLYPNISIFLFGSRAKGTARKYSDYDLGLYSNHEISFSDFLKIVELKERFEENSPVRVDCVNLTIADKNFITGIFPHIRMLVGFEKDFNNLRKLAYG